jgi:2'-5' RNA ligase
MKNQTLTQLANQIVALRNKRQGGTLPSSHGSILPQDGCIVPQPLIYKSGGNTGAMIALFLPISTGIHFVQSDPKALAPNELHVTLAYLGKAADLSPRQIMETRGLMRLISENHPPLTGHINGCGRFYNDDDDGDPFFIIPDLPALPNLRQAIIDGLRGRDIDGAKDHGFTPHITLTYLPHDKRNPFDALEKIPISFETISLVLGDDRYDYPLTQYAPLLSKAALVEKIGARHTQNEATLIQKIHDLVLDLGGECHPLTRRAGARHSRGDQVMVQRIHDDCSGLGAVCKAMPKKDRVYGSQVLKERTKADPETLKRVRDYCGLNEVTKAQSDAPNYRPASTPQRCANCRFFLGDPGRDWCELFDFTADPDYVSEAWEPQRPNEIPGYVANKAELAELAERILILRGGRTSGNWGHAGRKGKRGGSGAGGGFGRIGIKPGANRKTIKRAAKKKQAKAKAKA